MKEDIYSIACQCQTIIKTQVRITRNKIPYSHLNLIFTDYDIIPVTTETYRSI